MEAFDAHMPEFIAEIAAGKINLRDMGVIPYGEFEDESDDDLDPIEEMIGRAPETEQEETAS